MRVKLLTLMANPKGIFRAGTEIEVSSKEGAQLIGGGFAELIEEEVETKTEGTEEESPEPSAAEFEVATKKRGRPRKD